MSYRPLSYLVLSGALALSGCEKARNVENPTLNKGTSATTSAPKTIEGIVEQHIIDRRDVKAGAIFQSSYHVEHLVLRTKDSALIIKHVYNGPLQVYSKGDRVSVEMANEKDANRITRIKD